jgi:nucleoside-diphosphate-sugar epimerase
MARTAFVTGGTGFLGRHIVEQLTQQGWRVVALHRATSDVRALKTYPGVELAEGSITDASSLARAIPEGCDAVFHVAGNTSLWKGGDAQQTLENVDGTRFVVETCLSKKVGRLVHTSSVASWGEQHVVPFDETAPQHGAESFVNYERTK